MPALVGELFEAALRAFKASSSLHASASRGILDADPNPSLGIRSHPVSPLGSFVFETFFEDKILFKTSLKKILSRLIHKYAESPFIELIIFDSDFEPFIVAISILIIHTLVFGAKIQLPSPDPDNIEELADKVEEILSKNGLKLERDPCSGLKISNEDDLIKDLKVISMLEKEHEK